MSNITSFMPHSSDALMSALWEGLFSAICHARTYRKAEEGKGSAIHVRSGFSLEYLLKYEKELDQVMSTLNDSLPNLKLAYYAKLRAKADARKQQTTSDDCLGHEVKS